MQAQAVTMASIVSNRRTGLSRMHLRTISRAKQRKPWAVIRRKGKSPPGSVLRSPTLRSCGSLDTKEDSSDRKGMRLKH